MDFLEKFHSKYPGCTSRAMASGLTADGLSSYELLAATVPTSGSFRVLDLACGDGFLLKILSDRKQFGIRLFGLDFSGKEIEAARARLSRSDSVYLHCGPAAALPFEAQAFDFVLCHMAFMLLPEIDRTLEEVRRVLKPGGTFAATVGAPGRVSAASLEFVETLSEAIASEGRSYLKSFGDPRVASREGLYSLFEKDFRSIELEDFSLSLTAPPSELLSVFNLAYDTELLSSQGRMRFESRLIGRLQALRLPNGLVEHSMNLRKLLAIKRS